MASRGNLIAIAKGNKKNHSYIARKNIGNYEKGSLFSVGWFGKPFLKYSIGNVMAGDY